MPYTLQPSPSVFNYYLQLLLILFLYNCLSLCFTLAFSCCFAFYCAANSFFLFVLFQSLFEFKWKSHYYMIKTHFIFQNQLEILSVEKIIFLDHDVIVCTTIWFNGMIDFCCFCFSLFLFLTFFNLIFVCAHKKLLG